MMIDYFDKKKSEDIETLYITFRTDYLSCAQICSVKI